MSVKRSYDPVKISRFISEPTEANCYGIRITYRHAYREMPDGSQRRGWLLESRAVVVNVDLVPQFNIVLPTSVRWLESDTGISGCHVVWKAINESIVADNRRKRNRGRGQVILLGDAIADGTVYALNEDKQAEQEG